MTKIVIVSDGQTKWACDKSSLVHALDELGWTSGRKLGQAARFEPEGEDAPDTAEAYADLCNFIEPVEMPDDADELQTFTWHPSASAWLWS